jgi:Protein O-mannosyl-transferase TMEM260-like
MTTATTPALPAERPPYRAALAVFVLVLAGYIISLAPTVTFWDAGEFIATVKILGIPHPPGTPLFVIMAHVWAMLLPIGEFAYRTNLMTATISAAGTALFFLLVAVALRPAAGEGVREPRDPVFVIGGAAGAALASAFAFTVWQTSVDTSKPTYIIATTSAAAICWLAWLWRKYRGSQRAPHLLLVIMYIGSVSLGNHLMSLLVGPALIGFMYREMRLHPLNEPRERRVEYAQLAVVTGTWALLVGTGMGNTNLLILGAIIFLVGAVYAGVNGALGFAVIVLGLACVGASTYLYLFLRAGVHPAPYINEADPSNWNNLWAVIRRAQFPPRSPLDNPIYPSGPDNPGRSLSIVWLQLQNYLQYYDWQWSDSLMTSRAVFAWARMPFTLLFTALGIYGMQVMKRRDGGVFWLLLLLWFTTGLALMIYINFKPGFSLGFDRFPDPGTHEVRERDYFYTISYQVWGLFAGVGIAGLYRLVRDHVAGVRQRLHPPPLAAGVLALALIPFALNFHAANRKYGPDARLARDFPFDLLQSVEPYGILFTNGDNDTFPLWYLQEVEGIRQDVSVVNLSLANTDWYIRQLRDNAVRPFVPSQAPWYAAIAPATPPPPLHTLTDAQIENLTPQLLSATLDFVAGRIRHTYKKDTPFYVKDILILRLIQENVGRRPIYFSITAGNNWLGLQSYLTQQGLALKLHAATPPDSANLAPGLLGIPVDVPRTDSLVWDVYRYAGLLKPDSLVIEPTTQSIATNLSIPPLTLGQVYQTRGDIPHALKNLKMAYQLSPSRELQTVIQALQARDTGAVSGGDTSKVVKPR